MPHCPVCPSARHPICPSAHMLVCPSALPAPSVRPTLDRTAGSAYETLNTIQRKDSIEHARCSLLLRFLLVARLLLTALGLAEPLKPTASASHIPPVGEHTPPARPARRSLRGLAADDDYFQQFNGNVCTKPTAEVRRAFTLPAFTSPAVRSVSPFPLSRITAAAVQHYYSRATHPSLPCLLKVDILSDGTDYVSDTPLPCHPWEDPALVAAHVVMSALRSLKASRKKKLERGRRYSGHQWDEDEHHRHRSEIDAEVPPTPTVLGPILHTALVSRSHAAWVLPQLPPCCPQVRELKSLELELPAESDIVLSCCVQALEAHQLRPGDSKRGAWDVVRRSSTMEMAGEAGNERALRRFCQALVSARGLRGETLFYLACGAGATSLVQSLLTHGGDFVHATNDAAKTALHAATAAEDYSVCELLLRHTDLPVQGEAAKALDGHTPLDCCGVAFRERLLEMSKQSSFCCFLSHYKTEAFAEARWLHDELERLLGRKVGPRGFASHLPPRSWHHLGSKCINHVDHS